MPDARHLLLQDTALRYFHEVAQCGSLTEASARLHVAASAISRQIAEAHGGSLRAENVVDKYGVISGARFTLSLPAAETHER